MNLALPALVVFIVLLPGFIARSRVKRVERSSLDYSPFGQVVSEAVVWAGGMHVSWVWATGLVGPKEFKPDIALELLAANSATQVKALETVAAHAPWITAYFASLLLVAFWFPSLVRLLITHNRIDRAGSGWSWLFRFSRAPWYYLLSGADFDESEKPDLIAVSSIVDVSGSAYLYTGILEDYFVDDDGGLDRLVLQEVMRRPLSADKSRDEPEQDLEGRFYAVDGDYFVLRYSEAITLNIQYIKFARQADNNTMPTAEESTPRSAPACVHDMSPS